MRSPVAANNTYRIRSYFVFLMISPPFVTKTTFPIFVIISERVSAYCDDVSKFSWLNAADLIGLPQEFCSVYRGCLQGFDRLHPADRQLSFPNQIFPNFFLPARKRSVSAQTGNRWRRTFPGTLP